MITVFTDLEVYQESYKLTLLIHKEIQKLPRYELTDLGSQLRRASKSIPTNIAEGWAKRVHIKEFKKHLNIAIGSANEMEVHISLARDLGYWKSEICSDFSLQYNRLGGKLNNLKRNWRSF